jgi:uncharacterized protein (TIGR02145 family)
VDLGTGEVSGWARALNYDDGWDGWIKLSGGWSCGDNVTFTYKGEQVTYGTVESQGKCWLDRNLGASRVATAYNDSQAYGDLFQWGRLSDLHQNRTSGTTGTLSGTDDPGHGNFICAGTSPYDWRSPQNDNLWQGAYGTNNPCPLGWRIPTEAEWEAERLSWGEKNKDGAYASPLKLTTGGGRWFKDFIVDCGSLLDVGSHGYYWSSTVDGTEARRMWIRSTDASMTSDYRAYGRSVRCVQDIVGGGGYGVSIDFGNREFSGYAWGEMVIGWLSFNCANEGVCGPSDYKVMTSFSPAPSITDFNNTFPAPCSQSRIPTFSWQTDAITPYDYQIRLCSNSDCTGASDPLVSEEKLDTSSTSWTPACTYTCNISPYNNISFDGGTYYGQVRARNLGGNWGNWVTSPFTTYSNAYPYPDFLCDGIDCSGIEMHEDIIVTLSNDSTTYDGLLSCLWTLPDIATLEAGYTTSDCEIKVKFSAPPPGQRQQDITLAVTDTSSYSCSSTKTVEIRFPLPEYREVSPIGWLRSFFASLFAMVVNVLAGA